MYRRNCRSVMNLAAIAGRRNLSASARLAEQNQYLKNSGRQQQQQYQQPQQQQQQQGGKTTFQCYNAKLENSAHDQAAPSMNLNEPSLKTSDNQSERMWRPSDKTAANQEQQQQQQSSRYGREQLNAMQKNSASIRNDIYGKNEDFQEPKPAQASQQQQQQRSSSSGMNNTSFRRSYTTSTKRPEQTRSQSYGHSETAESKTGSATVYERHHQKEQGMGTADSINRNSNNNQNMNDQNAKHDVSESRMNNAGSFGQAGATGSSDSISSDAMYRPQPQPDAHGSQTVAASFNGNNQPSSSSGSGWNKSGSAGSAGVAGTSGAMESSMKNKNSNPTSTNQTYNEKSGFIKQQTRSYSGSNPNQRNQIEERPNSGSAIPGVYAANRSTESTAGWNSSGSAGSYSSPASSNYQAHSQSQAQSQPQSDAQQSTQAGRGGNPRAQSASGTTTTSVAGNKTNNAPFPNFNRKYGTDSHGRDYEKMSVFDSLGTPEYQKADVQRNKKSAEYKMNMNREKHVDVAANEAEAENLKFGQSEDPAKLKKYDDNSNFEAAKSNDSESADPKSAKVKSDNANFEIDQKNDDNINRKSSNAKSGAGESFNASGASEREYRPNPNSSGSAEFDGELNSRRNKPKEQQFYGSPSAAKSTSAGGTTNYRARDQGDKTMESKEADLYNASASERSGMMDSAMGSAKADWQSVKDKESSSSRKY